MGPDCLNPRRQFSEPSQAHATVLRSWHPEIRIPNETWVIVGSVAEPTITKFHLRWGENGYAVASATPTRLLSRLPKVSAECSRRIFLRAGLPPRGSRPCHMQRLARACALNYMLQLCAPATLRVYEIRTLHAKVKTPYPPPNASPWERKCC